MSALAVLSLFLAISSGLSRPEKTHNEPQYLDMLVETGQYELFAKVMNVPVDLVRPNEDARNEDPMLNEELEFGDIMPVLGEQKEESRQGLRFDRYPGSKWPNQTIPYVISSEYNANELGRINDAINSWNRQVSCLKLRPHNGEKDYVYVHNGNGCWSYLGNIRNGSQLLSLQRSGCVHNRIVLHEFEHAAGFHHEHNRLDREEFVEVLWDNIPDRWKSQYEITDSRWFGLQKNYDYYSIMHYRMKAPGTNNDAFRIKKNGINTSRIGNGNDFTQTDIDKINTLYC